MGHHQFPPADEEAGTAGNGGRQNQVPVPPLARVHRGETAAKPEEDGGRQVLGVAVLTYGSYPIYFRGIQSSSFSPIY